MRGPFYFSDLKFFEIETGVFEMLAKMSVRVGAAYIGAWAIIAVVTQLVA